MGGHDSHLVEQTTMFNNQWALIHTDKPTEDKKPDKTGELDLPKYIWPFTHLFNKKKFELLLQKREWDHKINLVEQAPGELNTKAYVMTIKEEETLNKWLDEQLKAGLIVKSSSKYALLCFFIPKKDGILQLVQDYWKLNQHTIKGKVLLPLIADVMETLDSAELLMEDQVWLDYLWDFETRKIDLDFSSMLLSPGLDTD